MSGFSVAIPGFAGANYQNPVTTFAALPLVGNLQGDLRVTLDTLLTYQWLGNAWLPYPPSGGGLTNVNISDIGGTPFTLGQNTMANSISVAIASNQSPLNIAGSVTSNSNINGLSAFRSSQQTVGTVAIQLTPTPLANRSSLVIKIATTTEADAVFIGATAGVTILNGYILYNNDIISLDLTPTGVIYAIATSNGQTAYLMELAE
jgi:hypothetical protein